jgi:hypothetical protein
MDWNLKKMWSAAAASLVAVTSLANAADDMQMRNLENRVSALEQRKGANGVINPSARPGVRDGWDIFVTGQALYWKANETGLTYAIQNDNCQNVTNYANRGTVLEARPRYNWGFNVGIGYNMPHDGWDLALNWTSFHTRNGYDCCTQDCDDCNECCDPCCPTTSCFTPGNPCCTPTSACPTPCGTNTCTPTPCPTTTCCPTTQCPTTSCCPTPGCCPTNPCDACCCECPPCLPCCANFNDLDCCCNIMFPTNVNFAEACVPPGLWSCDAFSKWNIKLDMWDLVLGRDFFVSKYLSLRPNFGLKGVNIRQTLRVNYHGFNAADCHCPCPSVCSLDTPCFEDRVKDNQKYWGVGPRAGMDTLWGFGGGFGLYGNAAISLVYGRLKDLHSENFIFDQTPQSPCDDCCCNPCECCCVDECNILRIRGPRSRCDTQYKTRAITDLAIGLGWDRQFSDDRFHLGVNVGWEHHMFFGMNQFFRFHSHNQQGSITTNQGDLATQGLTFGARFDF